MAIIEEVLKKLGELGFYNFVLPFIIFSAVLYAILRKTKILGDSALINGLVAMSLTFLGLGAAVLSGVSLAMPMGSFSGQIITLMLIIAFGLLITGVFFPNVMEKVPQWIGGGGIMWWMIVIVIIFAVTSGVFNFIVTPFSRVLGGGKEIFVMIFFLVLFIAIIALVSGGAKK